MTAGSNVVRKVRGDVRRDQIVQAALKIIGKKGVSGLTTAGIAREVGISEANLYRHFKNKGAILYETGKGIGDAMRKNIESVLKRDDLPLAKLKRAFLLHLEFIEKNEGVPRLGFSEEMHVGNEKLKKEFLKNINIYSSGLESIIKEGQRSDAIRPDLDPRSTAAMLIGLMQVTVMKWSLSGFSFSLGTEGVKLWKNFEKCIALKQPRVLSKVSWKKRGKA
jgi:AcrR family transcriptional regulator